MKNIPFLLGVVVLTAMLLCRCTEKKALKSELTEAGGIFYFHGEPYTGVALTYYSENQISIEEKFTNGKSDLEKHYHENGKLKKETKFQEDEREIKFFDSLGQFLYEQKWKDGERLFSDEVKIGNQVWMRKNLNLRTFKNGDVIPEAKTPEEWTKAGENKQPAWCYYDNDFANGEIYGILYNWYAVNDSRGLAPEGWHIPSKSEWELLISTLSGEKVIEDNGYRRAAELGKSTKFWTRSGARPGSNESGLTILPGGHRNEHYIVNGVSLDTFTNLNYSGSFWSADALGFPNRGLAYSFIFKDYNFVSRHSASMVTGYSIRCVKN